MVSPVSADGVVVPGGAAVAELVVGVSTGCSDSEGARHAGDDVATGTAGVGVAGAVVVVVD
ncbi:MAG: hypothetical protein ABI568_00850, partial [Pseudarthrobacter sp.]